MRLNLLVIRSHNPEKLAVFYTQLGCTFTKHRHGNGPEHYAFETEGFVFEIYPETEDSPTTQGTRIGFEVSSPDQLVDIIRKSESSQVISEPKDSPWGRRAVIADPEGLRIELVKQEP